MKYRKIIITAIAVVLVGCLGAYYIHAQTVISIDPSEYYRITSVIDGDTIKAKVGRHVITVRMLGINTPETVDPRKPAECYGAEASKETKELLAGKSIQLKLNPNREEKDKYGRYLAFVYLGDMFINEFLLENGYAREYTYGRPYMYQKEFREIERRAKENRKGLWGECPQVASLKTGA